MIETIHLFQTWLSSVANVLVFFKLLIQVDKTTNVAKSSHIYSGSAEDKEWDLWDLNTATALLLILKSLFMMENCLQENDVFQFLSVFIEAS